LMLGFLKKSRTEMERQPTDEGKLI
jgi:PTS system fructose-specific IIC component